MRWIVSGMTANGAFCRQIVRAATYDEAYDRAFGFGIVSDISVCRG